VIYENGAAKLWQTEAGYISMNDSKYHYYLQDHQGNNRVVVNETGATEEVNHYYAFGGLFSSDESIQPFKYNGKELDTNKGLNWYDYGARQYDAALGRWFAVDPLAEKMYSWSPYAYCFNNPVKLMDVNGMFPGPGDLFYTPKAAAKDWGWYYNGASIISNREMGSSIYEVKKNNNIIGYSYTPAAIGSAHKTGFSKPQNNENVIATIHSHGNYNGIITTENGLYMINDNEFSKADKTYNNTNGTIGFLATPNGSLLEHNPFTNKITMITDNLPSDNNDPNRKNYTTATNSAKSVPLLERIIDWIFFLINN
jgi:RHS repeat-associated protein